MRSSQSGRHTCPRPTGPCSPAANQEEGHGGPPWRVPARPGCHLPHLGREGNTTGLPTRAPNTGPHLQEDRQLGGGHVRAGGGEQGRSCEAAEGPPLCTGAAHQPQAPSGQRGRGKGGAPGPPSGVGSTQPPKGGGRRHALHQRPPHAVQKGSRKEGQLALTGVELCSWRPTAEGGGCATCVRRPPSGRRGRPPTRQRPGQTRSSEHPPHPATTNARNMPVTSPAGLTRTPRDGAIGPESPSLPLC